MKGKAWAFERQDDFLIRAHTHSCLQPDTPHPGRDRKAAALAGHWEDVVKSISKAVVTWPGHFEASFCPAMSSHSPGFGFDASLCMTLREDDKSL